ncbi:helix-turn-helix domain-containing protein [Streptomyces phaeochromogenes]|uniref:TetR/AcrR family transcriptional regulator n=1 Tax=Streptomyces phaeochromogenes TaxID=1923 RepID=UPI002DD9CF48|nr:helix-turn-helix domain-containing protein [Streptomyces phaeochromogenes]WRZ34477.1 TetR/AcrR family transcriptional regulator [Streptomyces phaeochromogenes]
MPTSRAADLPESGTATLDWSGRRADARRNHERIVTAALQVFTERGLGATVPQVAARAGVGKAMAYRSYPTRADLMAAVVEHQLQWLESRALAATRETEPGPALGEVLGDVFERLTQDRILAEVIRRGAVPAAVQSMQRLVALMGVLLVAAMAEGRILSDAART